MRRIREQLSHVFVAHRVRNIFIVFHLGLIFFGSYPNKNRFVEAFQKIYSPYQLLLGLTQRWNMFAPNPGGVNSYVEAEARLANGETFVWRLPLPSQMGFIEKTANGERYRKFFQEKLNKKTAEYIWRDTSLYTLREIKQRIPADTEVIDISFYRHSRPIKPPSQEFRPHGLTTMALGLEMKKQLLYQYSFQFIPKQEEHDVVETD